MVVIGVKFANGLPCNMVVLAFLLVASVVVAAVVVPLVSLVELYITTPAK